MIRPTVADSPFRIDFLPQALDPPTLWGLQPVDLHDRYWAAQAVQVVRPGDRREIAAGIALYLLADRRTMAIFKIGRLRSPLSWSRPHLLWIRLHDSVDHGYREIAVTDDDGQFLRFERKYGESETQQVRLALTPDRAVAALWQTASDERTGWGMLRRRVRRNRRSAISVNGAAYDCTDDHDVMRFVRQLVRIWRRPDVTVGRARRFAEGVWVDRNATVDRDTQFVGPAWVGAGRSTRQESSVLGPAVLWDDPDARPEVDHPRRWRKAEPQDAVDKLATVGMRWRRFSSFDRVAKRGFDIVFALVVLALTLPIYPLIMLAIWLEDRGPFFFVHHRETLGGRIFPCLKFRSMRKNSEVVKHMLDQMNQADGPQFFINDDPRLTRVGRMLRTFQFDEFPQFINVLLGHMSVVGPRPSPRDENQFCPAWREARLSVRPGVTGLWQVSRTRRAGLDFQEWIKFDIEYVENRSWRLDVMIIWKTIKILLGIEKRQTG